MLYTHPSLCVTGILIAGNNGSEKLRSAATVYGDSVRLLLRDDI